MTGKIIYITIGLLCLLPFCLGYNMLVMCAVPLRSHFILCRAIVETLQERGHNVTLISAFSTKNAKFRDIPLTELYIHKEKNQINTFDLANMSGIDIFKMLNTFISSVTEIIFKNDKVIKLLNDGSETFDAYILEHFANDALFGFGVKYKCPTIALSPIGLMSWLAILTDNPLSIATVPDALTVFSKDMTLMQRVENTINIVKQGILERYTFRPIQEEVYNTYFPKESLIVPYEQIKNIISLVLSNSHPSIGVARPLLPNTIEIGGFHIGQLQPLPLDLQQLLDSSKEGVIYFSMGSDLKSKDMDVKLIDSMLNVFASVKMTVLWKFENDIPNKPSNVIIKKWLPQTEILAHPNIKLFITHGGLFSCTEAANFGIPLLVIPIFSDQFHNAKGIELRGQGVYIDYFKITEEIFRKAVNEVLLNKTYAINAKKIHELYNDRLVKPRQLLGYYVEHVIRTNGAKHLRSPKLPRYSLLLLDVALVIFVPIFFILLILVITWIKCFKTHNNQYKKQKVN